MTLQEYADALSIALAKLGARVRVKTSHSSSIYLVSKLNSRTHSIRVSDHPPGKRWNGGSLVNPLRPCSSPECLAESVLSHLKNGT